MHMRVGYNSIINLPLVSLVLVATQVRTRQLATRWDLATMNTIEKIEEFQPEKEKFTSYAERVELFFAANSIPEEKNVPVFLKYGWK